MLNKKILLASFWCIAYSAALLADVKPPLKKSSIGYLSSIADEVKLVPRHKRFFIQPRMELPILEDAPSYYVFLAEDSGGSYLCKVAKINRNLLAMALMSDVGKMRFRGGINSLSLPIVLKKGEELPVIQESDGYYIVLAELKGHIFSVAVPKSEKGMQFEKISRFERLEKAKHKKGLVYHNAKWVSRKKLELRQKKADSAFRQAENKWNTIKAAAEKGYVILKDGRIMEGRLKGAAAQRLLFKSQGRETWVTLDAAADLPLDVICARGCLESGKIALKKTEKMFKANEPGEGMKCLEKSLDYFSNISDKTPDEYKKALRCLSEAVSLIDRVFEFLNKNDWVIYKYKAYPRDELEFHIASGHVLFKERIWLKSSQICSKCRGAGSKVCANCNGRGNIVKNCKKCKNGLVVCHLCNGSGKKICPGCKGAGGSERTCGRCNGIGYIWVYRIPPPIVRKGCVIARNGRVVVNIPTRVYYQPGVSGGYIKSDCPVCNGSGKEELVCKTCGGKGSVNCSKLEECPYCKGKSFTVSVCEWCNGRKRIECKECGGKRYMGAAQEYKRKFQTEGAR